MESAQIKAALEALLFMSETPLSPKELVPVFEGLDLFQITDLFEELRREYADSEGGLTIIKVAGGDQMCTRPEIAVWVKKLYSSRQRRRLSQPALETLSIVAYKQPITRAEVEAIRGVDVSGILQSLLERNLIRISGRQPVPGRPILYATTPEFLEHFGLEDISALPKLEELPEILGQKEAGQPVTDNPAEFALPPAKTEPV